MHTLTKGWRATREQEEKNGRESKNVRVMVSRGLGQKKPNCTQVQTPQSVFTYVKPVESTFTFSRPEEAHPNMVKANKHPEELLYIPTQTRAWKKSAWRSVERFWTETCRKAPARVILPGSVSSHFLPDSPLWATGIQAHIQVEPSGSWAQGAVYNS